LLRLSLTNHFDGLASLDFFIAPPFKCHNITNFPRVTRQE
jgi:hypothetical protein